MRRASFALILLVWTSLDAIVVAAQAPSSEEDQHVLDLVRPARELAQQGKIKEAIVATEQARNKVRSSFGRADHWAAAYVLDDAARYRRMVRDFAGSYVDSRDATEIALREFGDSPRFAYFAESATALSYAAGECAAALENAAAAFRIYSTADGAAADRERTALTLINLLVQRGSLFEALATFDRAFGSSSSAYNVNALVMRARLALASGDPVAAGIWLDRAERSDPENAQLKPALQLLRSSIHIESGNLVESERLLDQLLARPDVPRSHRSQWLLALQQKGLLLGFKGQYSDAVTRYQRVFQEYSHEYADQAPPMLVLNHNLGWIYRAMSDYTRAELQFERTLASADRCYGPANSLSLFVLFERQRLFMDTGRLSEALLDAERAVRDAGKVSANADLLSAYALSSRALVLRRLGRLDDAYQDFLVAHDAIRRVRGTESWDLVPGYTELAELSLLRKDFKAAEGWARAALAIRERDETRSMWANGLPIVQLIDVAAASNRWAEVSDRGERLVQIVQSRLSGSQARSEAILRELRRSRELIERMLDSYAVMPAEILRADDTVSRLFQAMQLPHLTDLTSALRLEGVGSSKELNERRRVIEELESVRALIDGSHMRRSTITPEAMEKLLRRSVALEMELTRIDSEIRGRDPSVAELLRPALEPLSTIQPLLSVDEALYLQVLTENGTHGILLRRDSVTFRSSSLNRSTARRHVRRLRRALDLGAPLAQRLPFDHEAANALYVSTIGQFEAELSGVSDLIVVLDDAFQNLPPAVLVSDLNKPGQSGKGTFLIERFGLTIEPSVGAFRTLRSRQRQQLAQKPFIGFGDPVLDGTGASTERSATAGAGVPAGLRALSPLPETADELKRVAQALAASEQDVFVRERATVNSVTSEDLMKFKVISFATHGLLAGELRDVDVAEAALVLTPDAKYPDGLLTASKITSLKLRAELVVLSACNTGRTDGGGGAAGVSALARSFLFAGASSLIVSHWAVSSDATVELISEAIRAMNSESGVSKSQAMRHATIRVMRGEAGERYRGPEFWAPFVLIGDGRSLSKGNRS